MVHRSPRPATALTLVAVLALAACAAPAPSRTTDTDGSIRRAQWQLARSHEQRFEYDRAADLYTQMLNETPDDPAAAVATVRALRYAGELDLAQETARIALERIGPRRDLRLEQAKAQLAAGRLKTVRPEARALMEEEPEDWQGHALYALVLDAGGESTAALAEHRRAYALAPNEGQAINNLALAEAAAGNLDKALAVLEEPAGDPRASVHMRMNLALLYMLANQPGKAEALVRATLPEQAVPSALETLAQFQGRPDRARAAGRLGPLDR